MEEKAMANKATASDKYQTINGIKMKRCSTCKQMVPVENFSSRKASADGLAYSCKDCERKTAQKSYQKKKQQKKARDRYEEHKEEYKQRAKERYENNKEEALAYQKEWRASAQGKKIVKAATARRAQRIKEQTPEGRDYTREQIIKRDSVDGQCICQICKLPIVDLTSDLQIDHIVTIAAGGADVASNVRCAHKECNLRRPKDNSDL